MRSSPGSAEELFGKGSPTLSNRQLGASTTAWIVLSSAFALFCVLVLGSALVGKRYYDTATEPRSARLSVESGIVLFRDAVSSRQLYAQDGMELREGDELMAGQGVRATVRLFDGSRLSVQPGTTLLLGSMRTGRFHPYSTVDATLKQGSMRAVVAPPSSGERVFKVTSPHGTASLYEGNFALEVSESESRFAVRSGSATLAGSGSVVALKAGEKALMTPREIRGPMPEGDALVKNGEFARGFADWENLTIDEPGRPVEPGERALVPQKIRGRDTIALRVERKSERATHNETGLFQIIDKDVSDYVSLRLNADVRVDDQSLSGGGYMGYEYPVMIRVRYRDATGGQIDWSHGFFAKNPEGRPTPNGQEVPLGEWVSYDGDLMQVKAKPVHLISIEVLGAGHSFAGMIANVSLIGK